MDIQGLLTEQYVALNLDLKQKSQVIEKMLSLVEHHEGVKDIGKLREDVLHREQEMSTGIGKSIALPHAKTAGVSQPVLAFATLGSAMDFDSIDEKAKHTMALFKERNIRPLAGFVAIIVQIPIFIALYYAFFREDGGLPHVATTLLYSFVAAPVNINLEFLGFLNLLNAHNIILALFVGLLQYAVIHLSLMRTPKSKSLSPEKAQAQAMQQKMMLYFMPGLFAVISFSLPSAAGLYFATGNVVSLGQEWLIRRELRKKM